MTGNSYPRLGEKRHTLPTSAVKECEPLKVLDMHVNYFPKECYLFLKEEISSKKNYQAINQMKDFFKHERSDLLIRNCMRLY